MSIGGQQFFERGLGDLHCTKGKDKHQDDLLAQGNLEALDKGHRQNDDGDIRGDVDGCVGEPEGKLVQTVAFTNAPEEWNWNTHKDRAEECPAAVDA